MRILPTTIAMVLLGLTTTTATATEPVGRLFMTPEERAELDALRNLGNGELSDALRPAVPLTTAPDQQVVLNGVVRRSRGPDVVWVNGARATLEQASGALARLKPGQVWSPATGRVTECFGCVPESKPDAPPTVQP